MIEDELQELRLSRAAGSVRERALAAAGAALEDRRLGRWITGVSLVSVVFAVMTSLLGNLQKGEAHASRRQDPNARPEIIVLHQTTQEDGE